jgi:hypothetical protein
VQINPNWTSGGICSEALAVTARDGEGSSQGRIPICTLITALCWSIFGSISWVVIGSTKLIAPQLENLCFENYFEKTEFVKILVLIDKH